ncbi:Urocanase [Rhizoclosmatium globosum]|uniref:Urocanase n=1 Tax=Rhizoclosmatium globosum TaxID=329046 RepID=A0A1Y2CMF1_9FUNG|nr:Urocanase [Rhizoclosmatium globosum]|eukprot:ORY48200.1 Urocanase [Rhizoclosmatium globosum]
MSPIAELAYGITDAYYNLTAEEIFTSTLPPKNYEMKAYPIGEYPAKCVQAAAIMLQIQNNLDKRVAQFPHELITYGGNGSVFNNWAQYHLTMKYLSAMTEEQTLVMYSGHPHGLFPSNKDAPRAIVTNGMVIPNYSGRKDYDKMYALGVSQYGQMTAGSYCYIGPQGIVHGTTITVFVTSGLGGMSGAQPKAGVIAGVICVVAEVDERSNKRHSQGWLVEKESDLEKVIARIKEAKNNKISTSIGYHGNIVDLWERLAKEPENLVDLGSDQTSLHNPFGGEAFKVEVQKTLLRHIAAVDTLTAKGMRFWDYGNAFLLEASVPVLKIMGDIFSLGFGPFRWICTSGNHNDLLKTDEIAKKVIEELMGENAASVHTSDLKSQQQYQDNHTWISKCDDHQLVNRCPLERGYRKWRSICTIMLSRDHHDVSGTDSPWRETSNIYDGSAFCADMAVHNAIGDSFRGATSVSLHNGGGTGWGEAMNGGFLLLLDGSADATRRAKSMLHWDVNNGVSRRAWSGNEYAQHQIQHAMKIEPNLTVTLPQGVKEDLLDGLF